jgi:hypothetical protein
MAEVKNTVTYFEAERAANASEIALWNKAQKLAQRTTILVYLAKLQWQQIKLTHEFAVAQKIALGEPDLPDLADRMFSAIKEVEKLQTNMCEVNKMTLGLRPSANGKDLDIVRPESIEFSGWWIPAAIAAVVVTGIIARWYYLEGEVSEITAKYNGVITRSDMALCGEDKSSQLCQDWEKAKASGDYYKRETIIDSVKNAAKSVGKTASKGLGAGLALAIPLLIWLYAPRRQKN